MINKKSQLNSFWGMLILVGGLMVLLFVGIIFVLGSATLNLTFDYLMPEFQGLGMVGDWNATASTNYVLNPINSFVQNMNWFGGILYIFGAIGILGVAFIYKATMQKWLIPLFFILMIVLMIVSIFLSNIYETYYTGTDEIAVRLQEQTVLSFFILYSPGILAILGFLGGAIMFSGGVIEE